MHPKFPIATPQQFHDWFAAVDRSVAHSQEAHFRVHLATVATHRETCDALLATVGDVEADVASMIEEWRSVEQGGRSLKDACERLLEERVSDIPPARNSMRTEAAQDRFLQAADAISTRLEYFSELEQAMRMLNHPGESLVLQTDFLMMVERVDVCLEYMKGHVRQLYLYTHQFLSLLNSAISARLRSTSCASSSASREP